MRKRTRYLLLLVGFIFFLIFAPIIVLYVRGVAYDFKQGRFVKTGIFAIKTNPTHLDVFINGELKQKKEGDIKFLLPGEYELQLHKEGYFNWQKRLTIYEGKVTWASPQPYKIHLLKQNSPTNLAQDVLDFYLNDFKLVYLTKNSINIGSINGERADLILPKSVNTILTSDNNNSFLLTNSDSTTNKPVVLFFNTDTKLFKDLSDVFISIPKYLTLDENQVYYLDDSSLIAYDILTKSKKILLENIKAFNFENNSLYYVQQKNNINSLNISNSSFTQNQVLVINLPEFSSGQIIITFDKQILILADGNLYKANNTLEKIADNIINFNFDQLNSNTSILHLGQFDYYNPSSQNLSFVTRTSEEIKNLVVKNNIGYAFFINNTGLNAIELDTRDKQNQYLLSQGTEIKKFRIYNSEQNLIFLDQTSLKNLELR